LKILDIYGPRSNIGFSIFLVFFVVSMQQQIQNNLGLYVTSSFALLPLTGTTSILSGIIGGVFKLPTAKFIDLIGRAEGFAIMTGFATIGRNHRSLLSEPNTDLSTRPYNDGCLPQRRDIRCCSGFLLDWIQWNGICFGCLLG
jgi:hypothetical protein